MPIVGKTHMAARVLLCFLRPWCGMLAIGPDRVLTATRAVLWHWQRFPFSVRQLSVRNAPYSTVLMLR